MKLVVTDFLNFVKALGQRVARAAEWADAAASGRAQLPMLRAELQRLQAQLDGGILDLGETGRVALRAQIRDLEAKVVDYERAAARAAERAQELWGEERIARLGDLRAQRWAPLLDADEEARLALADERAKHDAALAPFYDRADRARAALLDSTRDLAAFARDRHADGRELEVALIPDAATVARLRARLGADCPTLPTVPAARPVLHVVAPDSRLWWIEFEDAIDRDYLQQLVRERTRIPPESRAASQLAAARARLGLSGVRVQYGELHPGFKYQRDDAGLRPGED